MVPSELYQVLSRLPQELPWLTVAKYFDRIESTQTRAVQFLPKTPEGAVLVLAEVQTKGVGREGRTWSSGPGGLWFTLAMPLKSLGLAQAAPFSTVAALQVAESLRAVNNLQCDIKWPNDIIYDGKKLAGILLSTVTKNKNAWMLVGVGVNVNNQLPADLAAVATSIALVRKQSQGRSRLLEAVLSALHAAWEEFDKTGFGPYLKAVEERLVGVGKPVQIKVGSKMVEGTMKAVDPQGNLLLDSPAGTKTVQAGEIVGLPA
jgi:BirA family transcriptional regulator, biotin operon repressor / biotin---[acetyl-CoA-carboxylase] ligase